MKILVVNEKSLFYDYYKKKGIGVAIYKSITSEYLRAFRRVHLTMRLPFFSVWYTKEFRQVSPKETKEVVIFDSMLSVKPANYLRKKYTDLRIIYWHWNHIDIPFFFKSFDTGIERWSYDTIDCEQYKMRFNTQFYIADFANSNNLPIERDCFFIGAVKTRGPYIEKCRDALEAAGLDSLFILSDNTRKDRERKWVEYHDILNYIKTSRCVIDIVPDTQYGMTLRPLEALFLKKKLITNYKDIIKSDFYHRDNIFILDVDDISRLYEFVKSPFNDVVSQYAPYYDMWTWLERFTIGEKLKINNNESD